MPWRFFSFGSFHLFEQMGKEQNMGRAEEGSQEEGQKGDFIGN